MMPVLKFFNSGISLLNEVKPSLEKHYFKYP